MRRLVIGIGIIAVIVVATFVLRDKLSANAADLRVGDCFDPPAVVGTVVKDVQHRPCAEAHLAEVFYVGDYDQPSATYPTEDAFSEFVLDRCVDAFQAYTGEAYGEGDLDIQPYWPTEEGWGRGDKEVTCFAIRVDGGTMTGSVRQGSAPVASQ
jgi:hypothetical protein